MKLFVPSRVESSLLKSAMYYEECRAGLGSVFLARVDETLQSIRENPNGHPIYEQNRPEQGFRRALLKQFPYIVLYSVEQNGIIVVEVAHTSREPGSWDSRE